jgi:hypothetical protein
MLSPDEQNAGVGSDFLASGFIDAKKLDLTPVPTGPQKKLDLTPVQQV